MGWSTGDRVELVRDVGGVPAGTRGKVASTSFTGDCDVDFEYQGTTRVNGVSPDLLAAPGSGSSGNSGCAVTALAVAGSAAALAAAAARAKWGA